MIEIDEVAETVEAYLHRSDTEHARLAPLLLGIDQGVPITARSTLTGHVTCSAVVLNPAWQVLHIHHNVLGRWLCPGGHLEPTDTSLLGAALREVEEETGIPAVGQVPLGALPVDIDVHLIPENSAKSEPEHWHFDLRYAFAVAEPPELALQAEEVGGSAWLPIGQTGPAILREKLRAMRSTVLALPRRDAVLLRHPPL
jgi:8-oxo-dGTP pyrophosphatase MutT (NUDIX family)